MNAGVKGNFSTAQRKALGRAELAAQQVLEEQELRPMDAENLGKKVEAILLGLNEWPAQERPNVSQTGKAVPGMCLGAVYVLGRAAGEGMQASAISQLFSSLTQLVCLWIRTSLPDFPFSSIQINYNCRT